MILSSSDRVGNVLPRKYRYVMKRKTKMLIYTQHTDQKEPNQTNSTKYDVNDTIILLGTCSKKEWLVHSYENILLHRFEKNADPRDEKSVYIQRLDPVNKK